MLSYFEAFCKDQFAALINICPQLITQFKKNGHETNIDASAFILLEYPSPNSIGFLIAEQRDFGTAKNINALYYSLLSITPFSKDERKHFDQLLHIRNLLVHHGGIITSHYTGQLSIVKPLQRRTFFDSIIITRKQFLSEVSFLEQIAFKIVKITQETLQEFIDRQNISQSEENKKALDLAGSWIEGFE